MVAEQVIRVLVSLDYARPDEAVLRALADLLGSRPIELTALHVVDEDLERAAALPGLLEISLSGQSGALDPGRLSRELAAEADAARLAFELIARRLAAEHGRWSHRFEIAAGQTGVELDRAAGDCDFILVTRALRRGGLRTRLARGYLALLRRPQPVLFVNEPWASGSSVVVLADKRDATAPEAVASPGESGAKESAVSQAERLARQQGLRLVVAVAPGMAAPQDAIVRMLRDSDETSIADLCLAEDARLLVIPTGTDLDLTELLLSLMDKLPCSLLKLP